MPKFVIVKDQPSFIIIKPDMPEAQSETKKRQRPQDSQKFPKMAEEVFLRKGFERLPWMVHRRRGA
jgi:hypothetical protein